jgi:pimeloyl-ACP methyl ester carboxylesterase
LALALTLGVQLTGGAAVPLVDGSPEIHELRIEVAGRTIRALCTDGSRRVLLLHGDGSSAETWRSVLERLDGSVGACAYDRAGSGASIPPPQTRGWFELLDELRGIHLALGFERSYVLVGHALGGLYSRLYAADRPGDVSGLVLLDPSHEDMPSRVRTGMPRDEWEAWARRRDEPNSDGVREAHVAERARGARLPDLPVTVLTATRRRQGGGWDARFLNEAARQVHASILSGITTGRHVPAGRSGHDIQLDEPDVVVREILRVIRISGR